MRLIAMGNCLSDIKTDRLSRKGKAPVPVSESPPYVLETNLKNEPPKVKSDWIQLAGHPDSFILSGEKTILKQQPTQDSPEIKTYRALVNDQVNCFIPKFYREVESNDKKYIEIEDLLQHFNNPNAIDIKMGTRTFQECEVEQTTLRSDLYEKLQQLKSVHLTPEEMLNKGVTKLRYMKFREEESSTASFGFRIEGIKMHNEKQCPELLKRIKTKAQITTAIAHFLRNDVNLSKKFVERLKEIRTGFENSNHFKTTEIIGSSLLLLYDELKADVWMIDFGKTTSVSHSLDHRTPWSLGNHEDGYLTGLDNLIHIIEELTDTLDKYGHCETENNIIFINQ